MVGVFHLQFKLIDINSCVAKAQIQGGPYFGQIMIYIVNICAE